MSFSLFASYFPTSSDVTAEAKQATRARLAAWLGALHPDLDMRPGSVFGNRYLDPMSAVMAGFELAAERLRQDLDPAGVAAGVVHDCDFVEAYLRALGGQRQESLAVVGYVQVTFDQDTEVEIPAGWSIQFGDQVFEPRVFAGQTLNVLRRGSEITGPDDYVLTTLATSRYGVVIPVIGYTSGAVAANTSGDVAVLLPGLVSVLSVTPFQEGRATNSVPALARRAQAAFQAHGFLTRAGTREQILDVWPDVQGVSVVRGGDPELLRGASNLFGIQVGVVDAYVTSATRHQPVVDTVRLTYNAGTDTFWAPWVPTLPIVSLVGIAWVGSSTLEFSSTEAFLVQGSSDTARARFLTASWSTLQDLWVVVTMPRSDAGDPLIQISTDVDGSYAWFTASYLAEPARDAVQRYVDAEEPLGLDVLVKSATTVTLQSLTLHCTRAKGVTFNEVQARTEIASYINNIKPGDGFDGAVLSDACYYAGAARVTNVTVSAAAPLGPARYFVETEEDPETDLAAWLATKDPVPVITTTSLAGLNFSYIDPDFGTEGQHGGVVTVPTCAYRVQATDINFILT